MILNCQRCNVEFEAKAHNSRFCSERCGTAWRNERKFDGKVEGYDYIVCPDPSCRQKVSEISKLHAQMHGFESPTAMAAHYGLSTLKCERIRERMKGANNPGYAHGGKMSPWSRKNPKLTEEKLAEYKEKTRRNRKGTRPNEIQSWINKGYSEEEARELVRERQRTNSVEKIAQRKGISLEEAQEIRDEITQKWLNTLNSKSDEEKARITQAKIAGGMRYSFSKIANSLFDMLKVDFPDIKYGEDEAFINHAGKVIKPDCLLGNKIIEFYGDFWHANPKLFESNEVIHNNHLAKEIWERDAERIRLLESLGYEILVVWEDEWTDLSKKAEVLERCTKFLLGN